MSDLDTYMKHYSSAMDCRSDEQKDAAREVQQRVKRTIYQNTRFNHVQGGISPKKITFNIGNN